MTIWGFEGTKVIWTTCSCAAASETFFQFEPLLYCCPKTLRDELGRGRLTPKLLQLGIRWSQEQCCRSRQQVHVSNLKLAASIGAGGTAVPGFLSRLHYLKLPCFRYCYSCDAIGSKVLSGSYVDGLVSISPVTASPAIGVAPIRPTPVEFNLRRSLLAHV